MTAWSYRPKSDGADLSNAQWSYDLALIRRIDHEIYHWTCSATCPRWLALKSTEDRRMARVEAIRAAR